MLTGAVEDADSNSTERGKTRPPTRPLIDRGWSLVMFKDGILVAEQCLAQQLNWLHDLQHSILALLWVRGTVTEGQSDEPTDHVKP